MSLSSWYNQFEERLITSVSSNDPEKVAHVVYFLFKQYPPTREIYYRSLKDLKSLLMEFDWNMRDIHRCLCHLTVLTKYSRHFKNSKR